MAWARVQSKNATSSGSSTTSVTFTSTPTTGNKIYAFITVSTSSATISTVKDGAGNSLVLVKTITNSGNCLGAVYRYDVPATPNSTITVTLSTTTAETGMVAFEASGLASGTSADLDGTWGAITGSSSPTGSPTYSSGASGEALFTFFGDFGNSATCTVPSGYTLDANSINTNAADNACVGYKNSTGGSEASSWTYTTTGNQWFVITGAAKLAGAAAPAPPPIVINRLAIVRASIF